MLRQIATTGVLAREPMIGHAIEYRLRRAYAFPLWPGYAREQNELLANGWTHAWSTGTFSILGRDRSGMVREVPLLAADHFFAEFLPYRGELQSRLRGLDPRAGDHERIIKAAVRLAPVLALRAIVSNAAKHHEFPAALKILDHSRFCRALADLPNSWDRPQETLEILGGADLGRHAEVAIGLLHAICGHQYLLKPLYAALSPGDVPPSLVFRELDAALAATLDSEIQAMSGAERKTSEKRRREIGAFSSVDQWAREARTPLSSLISMRSWPWCTALFAKRPMPKIRQAEGSLVLSAGILTIDRIGSPVMA